MLLIFNLSSANISKTVMGLKQNCAQLIIKILSWNNKYIHICTSDQDMSKAVPSASENNEIIGAFS